MAHCTAPGWPWGLSRALLGVGGQDLQVEEVVVVAEVVVVDCLGWGLE